MPSIDEVLDTAKTAGFEYTIMFINEKGDVRVAIGLNGLTKKISDAINSYIELLNNLGAKYTIGIYDVRTRQQITILDIPMYFTIVEETQPFSNRPGGYM